MFQVQVRDAFIRALNDSVLADEVYRQRPETIDDAAKIAIDFESYYASRRMHRPGSSGKHFESSPYTNVCAAAGKNATDSVAVSKPWSRDMDGLLKSMNDLKSSFIQMQQQWKPSVEGVSKLWGASRFHLASKSALDQWPRTGIKVHFFVSIVGTWVTRISGARNHNKAMVSVVDRQVHPSHL